MRSWLRADRPSPPPPTPPETPEVNSRSPPRDSCRIERLSSGGRSAGAARCKRALPAGATSADDSNGNDVSGSIVEPREAEESKGGGRLTGGGSATRVGGGQRVRQGDTRIP
eukprot:scaffold33410_cov26-Tisochrysis_lutea.AAC.3